MNADLDGYFVFFSSRVIFIIILSSHHLVWHVVPVEVVAEMGKPDRILKKKNFAQMVAKIGKTGWNSEEKKLSLSGP